jgi:hypothetical protein
MMNRFYFACVLVVVVAIGACRREEPEAPVKPNEPSEAALKGLFAAFEAKDCRQVEARIGGSFEQRFRDKGGCQALFEKDPLVKARLVKILSTTTDGRSKLRHLVRFVLAREHRELELSATVAWKGGRYRVLDM